MKEEHEEHDIYNETCMLIIDVVNKQNKKYKTKPEFDIAILHGVTTTILNTLAEAYGLDEDEVFIKYIESLKAGYGIITRDRRRRQNEKNQT